MPICKAVLGPGCNVLEVLGLLQMLLFGRIDTECKSHIQLRILIEYRMHMAAEHAQCNDKYK